MAFIKLSASEKRRLSVFGTCLVLAAAAWLLTALSGSYNFKVSGVLSYKNVPQAKAFHNLQSDTVDMMVQGTGWQMLFSGFNAGRHPIPVDLHNLEHQNYIALNGQLPYINISKEFNQKIISISPDTLYFDFSKRANKKIPVQLMAAVSYQHQYAVSNPVVIRPEYVTISGPAASIENVKVWKTDSLKLNDVDETVSTKVNLQPVREGNVSIYPKTVQVRIPVDEFTEKTLEIPVKLTNNPDYYNVKLFPQKVKVTFTIALNKYRETSEDFFEAAADFQLWQQNKYSVLPVKLTRLPSFCKIVRIEPGSVDFIIKK